MASIRENTVDKYYNNRFLLPQCNTSCTATASSTNNDAKIRILYKYYFIANGKKGTKKHQNLPDSFGTISSIIS